MLSLKSRTETHHWRKQKNSAFQTTYFAEHSQSLLSHNLPSAAVRGATITSYCQRSHHATPCSDRALSSGTPEETWMNAGSLSSSWDIQIRKRRRRGVKYDCRLSSAGRKKQKQENKMLGSPLKWVCSVAYGLMERDWFQTAKEDTSV